MNSDCGTVGEQPYEVGYIITFEDGRLDKFGQLPLAKPEAEPISVLKKLLELEPSIKEASYIFSSIRRKQENNLNPLTIEFKKNDIKNLLSRLARPGIIRTGNIL